MATDKKSFLLYCDLIYTVEKMPNEKAGELFKHILEYVNDKNPISDDLITNLTFEPIKQSLKRDLVKYEKIRERNTVNIGKRWNTKNTTGKTGIPKHTKNTDSDSVSVREINIPTVSEYLEYCKEIKEIDFKQYEFSLKSKYDAWIENDWKDGNNNKIKNWKSKIKNTIPFLKPTQKKFTSNHDTDGLL